MADIIGTKEAARILKVNISTVWRWAHSSEIPVSHTVGKQLFFDRKLIEAEARRRTSRQAEAVEASA